MSGPNTDQVSGDETKPQPSEATASAEAKPAAAPKPAEASDAAATEAPKKPRIQIGSQRDVAKSPLKPAAVQAAMANPVQLDGTTSVPEVAETVEIKSSAGLGGGDIDLDIDAALAGLSMDSVLENTKTAKTELELSSRVKGIVTKIHKDNVFFKLNDQFEGVAAFHHFKEEPKEGDFIEVIIRGRNKEDGLYELGVPGAVIGAADWDDIEEGSVVEALVTGSNTGGLEVKISSLSGFMPISQIDGQPPCDS